MGQLFEPTSGLRNVAVASDSGHAPREIDARIRVFASSTKLSPRVQRGHEQASLDTREPRQIILATPLKRDAVSRCKD